MVDLNVLPTAEALGSLGSLLVIVFLGVALLILWQVFIVLGVVVANLIREKTPEDVGHVNLG